MHSVGFALVCGFMVLCSCRKCSCFFLILCILYALCRFKFSLYMLSSLQVSQQAAKCIPAMVCPELTEQIRREVAASLHQRKGDFTCYFLTDLVTFTLPAGQHRISRQTSKCSQKKNSLQNIITQIPEAFQSVCSWINPAKPFRLAFQVCIKMLVLFTSGV